MKGPKGMVDLTIRLNKNTCYFLKTGKCSLNVVEDFSISPSTKLSTGDLLYCPKLYKTMRTKKEQMRPITIALCECGHGEVLSGHQRACIASQRNVALPIRAADEELRPACSVCGGQMTFDTVENDSGARIVTLPAVAILDEETASEE
ncbi:MAG: hypothetical protein IJP14_02000 [Clostridia bacterium]|nr:hypothetical protein [Clostridia bacterium]